MKELSYPSSSSDKSLDASLIKSNLKAMRRACCELISYFNNIPCESVAVISFLKIVRAFGESASAAFRGILRFVVNGRVRGIVVTAVLW